MTTAGNKLAAVSIGSFSLQLSGVELVAADTKLHLMAVLSPSALYQVNADVSSQERV